MKKLYDRLLFLSVNAFKRKDCVWRHWNTFIRSFDHSWTRKQGEKSNHSFSLLSLSLNYRFWYSRVELEEWAHNWFGNSIFSQNIDYLALSWWLLLSDGFSLPTWLDIQPLQRQQAKNIQISFLESQKGITS